RHRRAHHHLVDPPPLHGHAVPAGRLPGRGRRRARVRRRHIDRQFLTMISLAHLSDPHLGPLPTPRLSELASKRVLGFVNWTRKRRLLHRPEVLDALVADLKAQSADHIAVTGDLANISLPQEFIAARAWLDRLGAAHDVTVVPGNHDAYVRAAK